MGGCAGKEREQVVDHWSVAWKETHHRLGACVLFACFKSTWNMRVEAGSAELRSKRSGAHIRAPPANAITPELAPSLGARFRRPDPLPMISWH